VKSPGWRKSLMITGDDARRDRLSVVTEQSVKSAARHASEYFRKTDTNGPLPPGMPASPVELREEEKKELLRLRGEGGAEPLRRKVCATTREILPAEIAQVSRDIRRRDLPEARFLFLSFFRRLSLSLSPPISTEYSQF